MPQFVSLGKFRGFHVQLLAVNTDSSIRRESRWQAGLSFWTWWLFSSNPRATNRAFRTVFPPLSFTVHTQWHEMPGWPASITSSYAAICFHFWSSSNLACSNLTLSSPKNMPSVEAESAGGLLRGDLLKSWMRRKAAGTRGGQGGGCGGGGAGGSASWGSIDSESEDKSRRLGKSGRGDRGMGEGGIALMRPWSIAGVGGGVRVLIAWFGLQSSSDDSGSAWSTGVEGVWASALLHGWAMCWSLTVSLSCTSWMRQGWTRTYMPPCFSRYCCASLPRTLAGPCQDLESLRL